MAGIYIHIPYCRQACHYCNFHFSTSLHYKNEFIGALLKEIELQKDYLQGQPVETIYFGGGTPSLLSAGELNKILTAVRQHFIVADEAECTLEANPDDIRPENLRDWKEAGINRLSIGIQAFFDTDLQWMNRVHTAREAKEALQEALLVFPNITIDLIYGVPGLSDQRWKQNVETALAMGVPHLSCYALTIEPKTPLEKMIRLEKAAATDPDHQSRQFLLLMQWMEAAGYEHYEISNFAKPGWRSRHNSSYWQNKPYLGLGPSAHSYDGKSRQWNIANNKIYIDSLEKNVLPFETELLTDTQQLNEYIMTSLRTMEGLDCSRLDTAQKESLLQNSKRYLDAGMLIQKGTQLQLSREGKLLADGIAAALFF